MARRKSDKKNTNTKSKNKELAVVPRLRLEPRLNPLKSPKQGGKKKAESVHSDVNELPSFKRKLSFKEDLDTEMNNYEEQRDKSFDSVSSDVAEESMTCETSDQDVQSVRNNEIDENDHKEDITMNTNQIKMPKTTVRKGFSWNDRELMDLAKALQTHGFSDISKIADAVKTKNENSIRCFLKSRCLDARKDKNAERQRGRPLNRWTTLSPENLATWPNIRKWRRMAYDQMLLYTRGRDYSKPVISAICKRFHEEEKEPSDPQVINVKLIYKYIMDCMDGQIPPQLPPKESSLVLDLLQEVRSIPIAYDFEEERKFLQDFKTATKFKPFRVKDEFRTDNKKELEDIFTPNTVSVPEDVFMHLSRHKRLTQSFNPLVTPVWMLQKEQEYLEK